MIYDCCIILAQELDKNLELSRQTRERVDLGIDCYKSEKVKKLIMSGGHKDLGARFGVSLAEVMEKYALQNNVKKEDVIKEEISLESIGQLIFAKTGIIDSKNWKKILIISNEYHILRLKQIAKLIFDDNYIIEFKGVKYDFSEQEKEKAMLDEEKSIRLFLKTFKGINSGDDSKILRTLLSKHDSYNKEPEEFEKRLGMLKIQNS